MLVHLEGIFFCCCPTFGLFCTQISPFLDAAFSLAEAGCVGISLWSSWCRAVLLRVGVQQLGAEDRVVVKGWIPPNSHTENESQRLNERVEPQHTKSEKVCLFGGFFWKTRGVKNLMFNVFFMVRNG